MLRLLQLFGKWQGFRGGFSRLPGWARFLVGLAALPGAILAVLSILAFLVSLLALFLLTTPVFRLVSWVCGAKEPVRPARSEYYPVAADEVEAPDGTQAPEGTQVVVGPISEGVADPEEQRPRRQIDVRIVE